MLTNIRLSIILGILTITPDLLASSSEVTPAEQGKALSWLEDHWIGQQKNWPFSFRYNGPLVRPQNIWRRWIREHNLPRIHENLLKQSRMPAVQVSMRK